MTFTNIAQTVAGLGLGLAVAVTPALALDKEQARKLVEPFYSMLTAPATKDVKALAEQTLSPDWKSYASESDVKGRDAFVGMVGGFGKLIPDLKWEIKEVLVDGDRVIVRSEASGTPVGPMFGTPVNGKSFKIMTIDIHTFKDGKAITAYHIEDWASALRQVAAK